MKGAFQHTNRMGEVYYLQCKKGKAGKPVYSFARHPTLTPVAKLPEGYEARENPESGQVVIRRARTTEILPLEKALLEKMIRERNDGLLFIVDAEETSLIVYTSDMDVDARLNGLRSFSPMDDATAREMRATLLANASYSRMMRFTLTDTKPRLFSLDRWCFLGSIDTWYFLDGAKTLAALAEKYVGHLGQESFFELM